MARRFSTLALAALLLVSAGGASSAPPRQSGWIGSWASSQQLPEPQNQLAPDDLSDATLRQVVRLSAGGRQLRIRVSNAFGKDPLVIDSAHVALAGPRAALVEGSDRAVRFDGADQVTVPAGADYWSDPVDLAVAPLTRVAVSLHFAAPPTGQTGHPGSRATSFLVHGNRTADADLADAKPVEHWYQLAGIEVAGVAGGRAVVTLGDSITDGHGATTDRNDRWPDVLAERLQANPATRGFGVLNQGIGGNRLLEDGLGPNALARFDRDVLAQAGVSTMILLEGVNDLGSATRERPITADEHTALVRRITGAYAQIAARARAHGIKVIGATILPFTGSDYYHPDAAVEADRQALNAWIRAPGHFDAVIDFDRVTRDPAHHERLLPAFDSGDHLHPSPAGYKAMADAIPLGLLER